MEAELMRRNYDFIIRPKLRWSSGDAPYVVDASADPDIVLNCDVQARRYI